MKIRCKKCYKELDLLEEYCTNCGEHSLRIKEAMRTGDYGPNALDKVKTALIIFFFTAFLANGILQVIFAKIEDTSVTTMYNKMNALFYSSIICFLVVSIVYRKDILKSLFNGSSKELLLSFLIGIVFSSIIIFLHLLFKYTKVLPISFCNYLESESAVLYNNSRENVLFIILAYFLVIIVEEYLFRRILIDAIDESTLLSDLMIILISGLIGTVLDFAWIMSVETLIISLLSSLFFSAIYIYTNRSILVNIILRILTILTIILILIK